MVERIDKDLLLGLSEKMAKKIVVERGYEFRVLKEDGIEYFAEMDCDSGRVNVYLEKGIVTDFRGFF